MQERALPGMSPEGYRSTVTKCKLLRLGRNESASIDPVQESKSGSEQPPCSWFWDFGSTTTSAGTGPDGFLLLAVAEHGDSSVLPRLLPNATHPRQRRRSHRNPRIATTQRIVQAKWKCWP